MDEETFLSQQSHERSSMNEEMKNLRKILAKIISYKYYFVACFGLTLVLAWLYNTYTIPVYKISATILIEENKKSNSTGNEQLLEGFGLMPGMRNLDNQIMVLSSRALINKTLDKLSFDTEYYIKGLIRKRSVYPSSPIVFVAETGTQLPEDVEFSLKYLDDNMFRINAESDDSFDIHRKSSFGEKIEFQGGSFRIFSKEYGWQQEKRKRKLFFIIHSRRNLIEDYITRLKVEPGSKKGTIIRISLKGTNKKEDLAFLNEFTRTFLNISLEKKNAEAIRTIQFIDDQLIGISDSLDLTESQLQKFRSRNKVMNLSAQGQVLIDQAMNLEIEKARLGTEAKYFDYLTEYLEKEEAGEVPVAPATLGIVDPGLTKLVADLADLHSRYYSKGMGEKNPLQSQLEQQIQSTKEALKETVKGMKESNSLAFEVTQEQINSINAKAYALPQTERELLGIERKYKLNDGLYTFLLEKRAVAQMQKASNVPDNEMIDYPEYENTPVNPKKPLVYLFALFVGIGLPFAYIFLKDIFNNRINDSDEINKITDISVIGYIPHSLMRKKTLVLDEPDCELTEAFRLLRSRMKFFTKEIKGPVILITSSMPNEGKTITAINLASAYSLLGKKTVLLGFDLRKPKIYSDFGLDNEHGISTWLIGKDKVEDIIKETHFENLHIIPSGPIPPNPAELTTLDKTSELIRLLKKKYDCIIIDSSPRGTVSDTFHLASLADVCLLVIRQNLTIKDLLSDTLKDLKASNVKSLSLVMNDIFPDGRPYRYGGIYNHSYNNRKGKSRDKNRLSFFGHILRNQLNF
jgi:tyrosine-protein kinase Etk/Wzc